MPGIIFIVIFTVFNFLVYSLTILIYTSSSMIFGLLKAFLTFATNAALFLICLVIRFLCSRVVLMVDPSLFITWTKPVFYVELDHFDMTKDDYITFTHLNNL